MEQHQGAAGVGGSGRGVDRGRLGVVPQSLEVVRVFVQGRVGARHERCLLIFLYLCCLFELGILNAYEIIKKKKKLLMKL